MDAWDWGTSFFSVMHRGLSVLTAHPTLVRLPRVIGVRDGVCGRDVDLRMPGRGRVGPAWVASTTRDVTVNVGAGAGLEVLVLVLI